MDIVQKNKKISVVLISALLYFILTSCVFAESYEQENYIEGGSWVDGNLKTDKELDKYFIKQEHSGSIQLQLSFPGEGKFDINLYNVDENGSLEIVDSYKLSEYKQSDNGYMTITENKLRVPKGLYMIEVTSQYKSNFCSKPYKFMVKQVYEHLGNYEVEDNDTVQSSMTINLNKEYTGNLPNYDADFYKVDIPMRGVLFLEMNLPVNGDYKVETFYDGGKLGLKSVYKTTINTENKWISGVQKIYNPRIRVPKGTYYFKVSRESDGVSSDDDYNFKVNYVEELTPFAEKEFNDTPSSATEIFNGISTTGNVYSFYDKDYYYINIPEKTTLEVYLEHMVEDNYIVNIYRVATHGELVKVISEEMWGSNYAVMGSLVNKIEKQTLEAGKYYIEVSAANYISDTYASDDYKLKPVLGTPIIAEPATTKVRSKECNYTLGTYNINNLNYIKLSDLAVVVQDSKRGFNIEVNSKTNLVNIITNSSYKETGLELKRITSGSQRPIVSNIPTYLDGKPVEVIPYSINGRTYYNLRELASLLNINVHWDATSETIILE